MGRVVVSLRGVVPRGANLGRVGSPVEKTVVVHDEEAFLVAHAQLAVMARPSGPFASSVLTQTSFEAALHELEGVFDPISHEPARLVDVDCDSDPAAAVAALEGHLSTLIVDSSGLEDALRATRARDYVRAAATEWARRGE